MKIYITVKQIGKKKAYLSDICYEIPESISIITLADLIRLIVVERVEEFNAKIPNGEDIAALLTQEEIDAQAQTGKIGFGQRFDSKDANLPKAVESALSAFSDGLYRVFADEREATFLDELLNLRDGSKIAFIRLTFLSGRLW